MPLANIDCAPNGSWIYGEQFSHLSESNRFCALSRKCEPIEEDYYEAARLLQFKGQPGRVSISEIRVLLE